MRGYENSEVEETCRLQGGQWGGQCPAQRGHCHLQGGGVRGGASLLRAHLQNTCTYSDMHAAPVARQRTVQ